MRQRRTMNSLNCIPSLPSISQEWKRSSISSSVRRSWSCCKHFFSSSRSIVPFESSSAREKKSHSLDILKWKKSTKNKAAKLTILLKYTSYPFQLLFELRELHDYAVHRLEITDSLWTFLDFNQFPFKLRVQPLIFVRWTTMAEHFSHFTGQRL